MSTSLWRALALTAALALFFAGLGFFGIALPLFLGLGIVVAVVACGLPWIGVRWLDGLLTAARAWRWRHEEGQHHAFGGLTLAIEDDGRHCWIAGADLQRALHTNDRDEVLAARLPGRWRRDSRGRLMLRVDAVVEHLGAAPGRMAPRTLRLRRYLEREVLFPAAQRARRRAPPPA